MYVYTCTYKNLWLTPQNIMKEHLPGIIKGKEYRDIKMHAFQWKSIKSDCHKFISIINVKLASWMRNVNGLYTRRRSCCANIKIPLNENKWCYLSQKLQKN